MENRRRGPYGKIYNEQEKGFHLSEYDHQILCDDNHDVLQYDDSERLQCKKARTETECSPGRKCVAAEGLDLQGNLIGDAQNFEQHEVDTSDISTSAIDVERIDYENESISQQDGIESSTLWEPSETESVMSIEDDRFDLFDYDSDVDLQSQDTDEILDTHDPDSEPLYPGSSLTLGALMLLLALFVTKHNIVGDGIQQLLNILSIALPNENKLCSTLHEFKTYYKNLKNPIIKHFYCRHCHGFIENEKTERCPYSSCGKLIDKEYFLEMPIEGQVRNLFLQNGFYEHVQSRFSKSDKTETDSYCDIYDGSLYKEYCKDNGPLTSPDNISFTFNTDGASVFKSSNVSVWPLFLVINELPYKIRMKSENMLLAGLWFGKKKPDMGTFLKPFLQTFQTFKDGFIVFSPTRGHFNCRAFLLCGTADLPARCILCNSIQFNGSYSCWKCLQRGETAKVGKGHTHVYPYKENAPKLPARTKEAVLSDARKALANKECGIQNFVVNGIKGPSWLSFFPLFNIVDGIAIDYMHGVLLGVQKQLLSLWFSNTHKGKSFNICDRVSEVDERLLSIRPTLNISRLPRSIQNDLKYWKASEYRSFLLYYGAPILKGILDSSRFAHFLLLVNAVHTLLKTGSTIIEVNLAEAMLFEFVSQFSCLYDTCYMTLNLHQLVHLADSVRSLGPLYTHSCFPFEDKNGILLRMICGTQNIDNQIITGVSFLQKLPELKQKTIESDSELEYIYNSIEHPNILNRGIKISNNEYVLGAVKPYILSDTEHGALCRCVGFDPEIGESVSTFKRIEYHGCLIYGRSYKRMKRRDNSAICYKLDSSETVLFGCVKHFLIVNMHDDIKYNTFCVIKELICTTNLLNNTNIIPIQETQVETVIPLSSILESVMYISFKNSMGANISYVCKFPNKLEKD